MHKEDKAIICRALVPVLQMTRDLSDLENLEYERVRDNYEVVRATFINGTEKTVNVTLDSGCAMIRDIMRGLQ